MSLSGFKTLFDNQSTRLDRIRVLASPDDLATGCIDNVTWCNKAYFEGVGPTGTTGQWIAAMVDVYDVLQGRVTDQSLNILGLLKMDSSGIGIGQAIDPSKALAVLGDVLVTGDFDITGMSTFGDVAVDGGLVIDAGGSFINESGVFKIVEQNITAILGQTRNLFSVDQYSNMMLDLYTGSRSIQTQGHAANFGLKYGSTVPFYVGETGGVFSGGGFALGELPSTLQRGFHAAGYGGTPAVLNFYSPASGQTGGSHVGGFVINSFGSWTPGSSSGDTDDSATIMHTYHDSGTNAMLFLIAGDNTMVLEKDKATFSGGSGYSIDFTVKSHYADAGEYFCRLFPNITSPSNRHLGGGVSPCLQLGSGRVNKTLRIGFDSFHEWNVARMYLDAQSASGTIPAIVLGSPLGTNTDPIDNFIVCDSPWLVAVNSNVRTLASLHGDKQGLLIGRGLAGTNDHKAGLLWLEDYTGYAAAICFGTNTEQSYLFVKDGVTKVHENADDSPTRTAGLGTTYLGAHKLPFWTTEENLTTGLAAVIDEIEANVSEKIDGAAVVVLSNDDQSLGIFVYSSAASAWYSFRSTTRTS